jgi:voltage-gated potassium channel
MLEPEIAKDFFWYFFVTVTTVGYGDISPSTSGGKLVGIFIMICGGLFYTTIIAYLYTFFSKIMNKSRKGLIDHNLKNHVVIIGYNPQKTEEIIDEIRATKHKNSREILLCVPSNSSTDENPLENHTRFFVKGNMETERGVLDIMDRTSLKDAYCVILHLDDDEKTFSLFTDLISDNNVYIIATLKDVHNKKYRFKKLYDNVECVNTYDIGYIVSALQHPGSTRLLENLSLNRKGHKLMRLNLSKNFAYNYFEVFVKLKEKLNIQLSGIALSHVPHASIDDNPANDTSLAGKGIFYVGSGVITEDELNSIFSTKN